MAYELDVSETKKPIKTRLFSILFFSFICVFILWNTYSYLETERLIEAQSRALGEASAYSHNLPLSILKEAEKFKKIYLNNRLADHEVDGTPEEELKKSIIHDYEKSINALYTENIKNKDSLTKILKLITYVPDMFSSDPTNGEMAILLKGHNPELLELTLNYKIITELNDPNNKRDAQAFEKLQKTIIAEQQAKILTLSGRISSLERKQSVYLKEIDNLKNPKPLLEESE